MSILGTAIGGAIGAFGRKPTIPLFTEINPDAVQKDTIAGNTAAVTGASKLASAVNAANRKEALTSMEAVTPGASNILSTGTAQLQAMLRGQLPADVKMAIEQSAASRAAAGGFGGTGAASALTARDLGATSLGLVERGLSSAESWLAGAQQLANPQGFFNLSSMFFTPQERLMHATNERNSRYQRDLLAEQVDAAPDPFTAAMGREIDRFFNTAASVGMMYAGGGMGGMGGAAGAVKGGGAMNGGVEI